MCKPKSKYDNTPMAEAIAEAIHSELHREILRAVLLDGWSYERIAAPAPAYLTKEDVEAMIAAAIGKAAEK